MNRQRKPKNMKKMKFTAAAAAAATNEESVGEDRISSLSDDLIHHILSFVDSNLAVQTSILSKRWKLVWNSLPFFKFPAYRDVNFVDKFFTHRNHAYDIFKFHLYYIRSCDPPLCFFHKIITYAISHNVQHIDFYYINPSPAVKLSTFSSTSLKKLQLCLFIDEMLQSDRCWDLPALTTLAFHFKGGQNINRTLPKSYFNCLSSLETLSLGNLNLPDSVCLLSLKTLSLTHCNLPSKPWNLPALLTLKLEDVEFPQENTSGFLLGLVNLQNLTLFFISTIKADWVINCPQLVNLEISYRLSTHTTHLGKILVTSRKLRNFTSFGFIPVRTEASELENVNINFWDPNRNKPTRSMKKYFGQVTDMFRGLSSARILTLDFNTIKVLSSILELLVHSPHPFYNLKYVKVPQGYEESSMSIYLKCYLLGNSPKATIVTTLPQNMIRHTAAASVTDQNVVQ